MAGIDVIGKIATPINNERGAIKEMIRRLTEISQVAVQAGGDIGKVVSANIQKTITDLNNIANGPDQSSLISMIQYLKTVPLGTMFPLDLDDDITANNAPSVVSKSEAAPAPAAPAIDMTAHTENGPQSAVAAQTQQESVERSMLADYFKLKESAGIESEDMELPQTPTAGGLNFKALTESMHIADMSNDDLVAGGNQFRTQRKVVTPTVSPVNESNVVVPGETQQMQESVEPAPSLSDWRTMFAGNASIGDLDNSVISDGLSNE